MYSNQCGFLIKRGHARQRLADQSEPVGLVDFQPNELAGLLWLRRFVDSKEEISLQEGNPEIRVPRLGGRKEVEPQTDGIHADGIR